MTFASEEQPCRISSLTALFSCPGLWVSKQFDDSDSGGKAAHTGTAVGRGVELFHRGDRLPSIFATLEQESSEGNEHSDPFPLADLSEVREVVTAYAADPRNQNGVVLEESLEEVVELTLPAHPSDPTGVPIFLPGHIDQVRLEDGVYRIWDLKNSKRDPEELVPAYLWQQMAYTAGYAKKYPDRRVEWGGLIRTKGYLQKTKRIPKHLQTKRKTRPIQPGEHNVFLASPLRPKQYSRIIDQIRLQVARVRAKELVLRPGRHCGYCPEESISRCLRTLTKRGFSV